MYKVITPNKNSFITYMTIRNIDLSHHFLIEFDVNVAASSSLTKAITYRPWKKMDHALFCQEIQETLMSYPDTKNMAEKITVYNKVLREKFDKYSPLTTKVIKVKPAAPWFDSEYQTLRRKRRKAEKTYRKTKSDLNKNQYIQLRKETTKVAKLTKIA